MGESVDMAINVCEAVDLGVDEGMGESKSEVKDMGEGVVEVRMRVKE